MAIKIKCAYELSDPADGSRILVDRFWPRGVTRAELNISRWLPQLAPSDQLRRCFGHNPARWREFRERYLIKLEGSPEAADLVGELRKLGCEVTIALIYGA